MAFGWVGCILTVYSIWFWNPVLFGHLVISVVRRRVLVHYAYGWSSRLCGVAALSFQRVQYTHRHRLHVLTIKKLVAKPKSIIYDSYCLLLLIMKSFPFLYCNANGFRKMCDNNQNEIFYGETEPKHRICNLQAKIHTDSLYQSKWLRKPKFNGENQLSFFNSLAMMPLLWIRCDSRIPPPNRRLFTKQSVRIQFHSVVFEI